MSKVSRFVIIKEDPRLINIFAGVLFIFSVATIAHFLFSPLGFNPTDDGWVLAGSRRIIEGQIPHRDVISHMPTFSFFFHAPFILFGGNYVFFVSRYFVWIQFASIAWIWTLVIARSFKVFLTLVEKFAVALVVFSFSTHYFPIMAWYTIDGLFFVSLGILLCDKEFRWAKMVGYVLIGTAPLCKQSFLPMIPIAIILFKDWRQLVFWITTSIPAAVYVIYLAIFGAIPDAILQLTTYSDFVSIGISPIVNKVIVPLGIIVGGLAAYMVAYNSFNSRRRVTTTFLQRFFGILMLFGIIFSAAWTLFIGLYRRTPSFGIFGAVIGVILYFIAKERKLTNYSRFGLLAVCVAWCTSLSLGYRFPTLGSGPLILFLMASVQFSFQLIGDDRVPDTSKSLLIRRLSPTKNFQKFINALIILAVVASLVAFGIARTNYIYREQPASQLTYDLGDVLEGAKGVKTNNNTYSYFLDLQTAKNIVKENGKEYCILPDTAANWVKDSQSNPLSTDSTSFVDFRNKELLERVICDLEEKRGIIIVIVQKYEARSLSEGFIPPYKEYEIVNYVRSNFDKIEETQYFELYE